MSAAQDRDRNALLAIDAEVSALTTRRRRIVERMIRRTESAEAKVLTIQQIIDALDGVPTDLPVHALGGVPLGWVHVYRMNSKAIAIAPASAAADTWSVGTTIIALRDAIDTEMEHAKGAVLYPAPETKVFVADLHEPGVGVVGVRVAKRSVTLMTKDVNG